MASTSVRGETLGRFVAFGAFVSDVDMLDRCIKYALSRIDGRSGQLVWRMTPKNLDGFAKTNIRASVDDTEGRKVEVAGKEGFFILKSTKNAESNDENGDYFRSIVVVASSWWVDGRKTDIRA